MREQLHFWIQYILLFITDAFHIPALTRERISFHFTPASISLIHPINIKHIIIRNNYSP